MTAPSPYLGAAWAEGPGPVYGRLAAALVAASPVPLAGRRVLDLGAGSGAASDAVGAVGGRPVALDVSLDMLRHDRAARPPAVVGDGCRLPFAAHAFDAVIAAFVLSHVPDPVQVLSESRRVTGRGGVVLATSFSARSSHPCKAQVDEVAARWGWRPPRWYTHLKAQLEPQLGDPDAFAGLATAAGLADVGVQEREVDTGVSSPEALVAWRLGMAHLAPFVASLGPAEGAALAAEARAAVGPRPQPLRPLVLILSSRVPASRIRMSA